MLEVYRTSVAPDAIEIHPQMVGGRALQIQGYPGLWDTT